MTVKEVANLLNATIEEVIEHYNKIHIKIPNDENFELTLEQVLKAIPKYVAKNRLLESQNKSHHKENLGEIARVVTHEKKLNNKKLQSFEKLDPLNFKLTYHNDSINKLIETNNFHLGRIKFFNSIKGFGFISNVNSDEEYFVHISKLITENIDENDLVVFQSINSKKKQGELEAINVTKIIPVLIYNKGDKSFATPLLPNYIENEILLIDNHETGFGYMFVKSIASSYWTSITDFKSLQNDYLVKVAKSFIQCYIIKYKEYKQVIDWLTIFLKTELSDEGIATYLTRVIETVEKKPLLEIYRCINDLLAYDQIQPLIENKKKHFNKISFILWSQEEIDLLPEPIDQEDENLRSEILNSLDWQTIQEIILKILLN